MGFYIIIPGSVFFDTLVTLDAPYHAFDVIDVREYNLQRSTSFWVSIEYGTELVPFFMDEITGGGDYKVDMDCCLYGQYWYYSGAYKSIAIVVDKDPVSIRDLDPHSSQYTSTVIIQNYPNPFNPTTTISFDIPGEDGGEAAGNARRV